jgi:hypothetical protein
MIGSRVKIVPSSTSKSILVSLYYSPASVEDGIPERTLVVGSLEGEDAFPDIFPGMFEFSDNGRNPYSMN